MNVILASSNQGKMAEFTRKLAPEIIIESREKIEVQETGESYFENALLKAKAYYETYNQPALSDDSGLNLEAFPYLLGLFSARYKPELNSYLDKCNHLLEHYKENKIENRAAYFSCVLCLYKGENEIFFFEGRSNGSISETLRGGNGFGYDPIFMPAHHPENKSFSEDLAWKEEYGHRAKAIKELKKFLSV